MASRQNKNRGYMQLRVWQDAVELYRLTYRAVRDWPFEHKKVASQAIAFEELDSVSFRLENGLLKLIESLQRKRNSGDWLDSFTEEGERAETKNE